MGLDCGDGSLHQCSAVMGRSSLYFNKSSHLSLTISDDRHLQKHVSARFHAWLLSFSLTGLSLLCCCFVPHLHEACYIFLLVFRRNIWIHSSRIVYRAGGLHWNNEIGLDYFCNWCHFAFISPAVKYLILVTNATKKSNVRLCVKSKFFHLL